MPGKKRSVSFSANDEIMRDIEEQVDMYRPYLRNRSDWLEWSSRLMKRLHIDAQTISEIAKVMQLTMFNNSYQFPAPRPSPIEARDGACASASRMIPPQRTENLSKDARPSRIKKPGMLAGLIAFCALPWVLQ